MRYNAHPTGKPPRSRFTMPVPLSQISQWLAEPSEHRHLEFKEVSMCQAA